MPPERSAVAGALERGPTRDKWIVAAVLVVITVLAAGWTLWADATGMSAWDMTKMTGAPGALLGGLPDMAMGGWTLRLALATFAMWGLMMVAMMVPSAARTVLLYGTLHRDRGVAGMLGFLTGYLAIWALFSLVATLMQFALVTLGWMSGMWMNIVSGWLSAGVLIAAGLYQLTRLKAAFLWSCRAKAEALTAVRSEGRFSAFRMGAEYGRCCLGCCWGLMALLFVGGVMNLWWILGVALLVAVEKLSPWGDKMSRPLGVGLLVGGGLLGLSAAGSF